MAKKSRKANTEVSEKLVPQDGGAAYTAGFGASDCPYDEEHPNFGRWNEEWDAAADASTEKELEKTDDMDEVEHEPDESLVESEEQEAARTSVVKEEYRARYAEMGHPAHCGDELAVLLNNLCLAKAGIDMPRFEHICAANGVDLSKYNRTTRGWQGRLRMTGRNMLAGKVYEAGGLVKTDGLEGAEAEYKLSSEWMAKRRKKAATTES